MKSLSRTLLSVFVLLAPMGVSSCTQQTETSPSIWIHSPMDGDPMSMRGRESRKSSYPLTENPIGAIRHRVWSAPSNFSINMNGEAGRDDE